MALRYKKNQDNAPVVTASGQGLMAEKIISLAKENKIPVEENAPLAEMLRKLAPGQKYYQNSMKPWHSCCNGDGCKGKSKKKR